MRRGRRKSRGRDWTKGEEGEKGKAGMQTGGTWGGTPHQSLPLAVQGLGLPEGDHGGLLWGPAQGLGVARSAGVGPLGGW